MNLILRWSCSFALALGIAACGQSDETPKTQTPPPKQGTVFDDTIANKERAERQTKEAMEKNQEKLDASMKDADDASAAK